MMQTDFSCSRWARLACLVVGGFALWACGDDGEESGGPPPASSLEVEADEYQFDPDSWTAGAGEAFSVDFGNIGQLEHEWVVIDLGEDIAAESEYTEDRVLVQVPPIPAGESVTEQLTIDEPGTYQVVCALPGHFDAGMEGSLVVE